MKKSTLNPLPNTGPDIHTGNSLRHLITRRCLPAVIALVALVACFNPRSNPLDPENPNADKHPAIICDYQYNSSNGSITFFIFANHSELFRTIWRLDTNIDGSDDVVDTAQTDSLVWHPDTSWKKQCTTHVDVVMKDGSSGSAMCVIEKPVKLYTTQNSPLVDDMIWSIAIDSSGTKWFGAGENFLCAMKNDLVSTFPDTVIKSGNIKSIFCNEYGNSIVVNRKTVYSGGLFSFYNNVWLDLGVRDSVISAVCLSDRWLWCSSWSEKAILGIALNKWGSGRLSFSIGPSKGLLKNDINCLAIEDSMSVWAGSESQGLLHISPTQGIIESFKNDPATFPDFIVKSLVFDSKKNLWLGATGILVKKSGTVWTHYQGNGAPFMKIVKINDKDVVLYLVVDRLSVDFNECIWMHVQGKGVYRFDGDTTWTHFSSADSTLLGNDANDDITGIAAENRRTVWIATKAGLVRIYDYTK